MSQEFSTDIFFAALPGLDRQGRIDLADLDDAGLDFFQSLIREVIQYKPMVVKTKVKAESRGLLWRLMTDARNSKSKLGQNTLALAYPFVFFHRGNTSFAAPLLLCNLQIEPASATREDWWLKLDPAKDLVVNHRFFHYLKKNQVPYPLVFDHLAAGKFFDGPTIVNASIALAESLELANIHNHLSVTACPTTEDGLHISKGGGIVGCGVLGNFEPTFMVSDLPVELPPAVEVSENVGHDFGVFPMDADQATVWKSLSQHPRVLLKGLSGVGKTQICLNSLTNALSNGKKCLVVGPGVHSLKNIQQKLGEKGLGTLSVLLTDPRESKSLLLNLLRSSAVQENTTIPMATGQAFSKALEVTTRKKNLLDGHYSSLKQLVIGDHNWTQTVGLFLEKNRKAGRELLSSQLHSSDFLFTKEELDSMTQAIVRSRVLYQKINTLRHPLSELHDQTFRKKSKPAALAFLKKELANFLERAERLQHRFIAKTEAYTNLLREHYEDNYKKLTHKLTSIRIKLLENRDKYGPEFENLTGKKKSILGFVTKRQKLLMAAYQGVFDEYKGLANLFHASKYFEGNLEVGKNEPVELLSNKLKSFEKSLNLWRNNHPQLVQEELSKLNVATSNGALGFAAELESLEKALHLFVKDLNEVELYNKPFQNKMLTAPMSQKFLEGVIEQMRNTQVFLRDFDEFYDWQNHWLQLTELEQKTIHALVKVNPDNWVIAFESWYLNNRLLLSYLPHLEAETSDLQGYAADWEQLAGLLPPQIQQKWAKKRSEFLKGRKKSNKDLIGQLLSKKEVDLDLPMQGLFLDYFQEITDFLPVVMVPSHNLDWIPQDGLFDYVIVEDAQYLPAQAINSALLLGKRAIICVDESKMPTPSLLSDPSLLDVLISQNFSGKHPNHLQIFPNLMQERPLLEKANLSGGVIYQDVGGRFNLEQRTSEEEAQRVITLLNDIRETPQRVYPSVGIVCLTKEQRDLVQLFLFQLKRNIQSSAAEKIERLERNGLSVLSLQEIMDQKFDVVILSLCLGVIDSKGSFQLPGFCLEELSAPGVWRTAFSMATTRMYVLNSIPAADLHNLASGPAAAPGHFLANLLMFAAAITNNDTSALELIQNRMSAADPAEKKQPDFLHEIALGLKPYFGAHSIRPVKLDNGAETLEINVGPNLPKVLLAAEAYFSTSSCTDFHWEATQYRKYQDAGYRIVRSWSNAWWKNPAAEARRLAGEILRGEG